MRKTREEETRDEEMRDYVYEEPSLLDTPAPPEGYSYRWIRFKVVNDDDVQNVSTRMQEGWEFVRPDELGSARDRYETVEHGRYAHLVIKGDVALAKCPTGKVAARRRYFQAKSDEQTNAVDQQLGKLNSAKMPLFNESKTEVTGGRRPKFD